MGRHVERVTLADATSTGKTSVATFNVPVGTVVGAVLNNPTTLTVDWRIQGGLGGAWFDLSTLSTDSTGIVATFSTVSDKVFDRVRIDVNSNDVTSTSNSTLSWMIAIR